MTKLSNFLARHGHKAGLLESSERGGPQALVVVVGAVLGAVLLGGTGGELSGWMGALPGLFVGALGGGLAGAIAGSRRTRLAEDAQEETYWRERPYADSASAALDLDLDLDLGLAPVEAHRSAMQLSPRRLGDIAANPMPGAAVGSSRPGSGRASALNWMRKHPHSLGDLAAQGK